MIHRAITIAGSDSGGGAGIQADLKTFSAFGVYGASAITALTAQNTQGVQDIFPIPKDFFRKQLVSIFSDIAMHAGKTGMLANAEIIQTLVDVLKEYPLEKLVVDPVMISKHGSRLLEADAIVTLCRELFPLAYLVTPNLHEAADLARREIRTKDDMKEAAAVIQAMGPKYVLVKGGHLDGVEACDVFFDGVSYLEFHARRIDTPHTHGTGCTLSSAIAANLALGCTLPEAIREAKAFITGALEQAEAIGGGISPVNHLWPIRGLH